MAPYPGSWFASFTSPPAARRFRPAGPWLAAQANVSALEGHKVAGACGMPSRPWKWGSPSPAGSRPRIRRSEAFGFMSVLYDGHKPLMSEINSPPVPITRLAQTSYWPGRCWWIASARALRGPQATAAPQAKRKHRESQLFVQQDVTAPTTRAGRKWPASCKLHPYGEGQGWSAGAGRRVCRPLGGSNPRRLLALGA